MQANPPNGGGQPNWPPAGSPQPPQAGTWQSAPTPAVGNPYAGSPPETSPPGSDPYGANRNPGYSPHGAGIPAQSPRTASGPPIALRAITSIWRLAIGFFGIYSPITLVAESGADNLFYLSQSAALLAGIYFAVLGIYAWIPRNRVDEPSPIPRLCVVVLTTITGSVFFALMNGDVSESNSLAIHLIVPGMVLIDWCLFGRNQEDMAGWHPFVALVLPLIYLGIALWRGSQQGYPLYPFLDADDSSFFMFVGGMLLGIVVLGFLLMGLGRIHYLARTGASRERADGPYDADYDQRYTARRR